jgi:hypothetical protein
MGKFGEGKFGVEYRMDSDTRTDLFNRLKHRNTMPNTKYVLSSPLLCPFEVHLFPMNVLRSTAIKASTLDILIM